VFIKPIINQAKPPEPVAVKAAYKEFLEKL